MSRLKDVIESSGTPQGKAWDLTIQALIFVSLVSFTVGMLPELSERTRQLLWMIELVTVEILSWSICFGYGDVYPMTLGGRFLLEWC